MMRNPGGTMRYSDSELRAAYAQCRRLAERRYENFPVASRLVPREQRDALAAVYAFARYADDWADEPGRDGRLEALAEWRRNLGECYVGEYHHGAPEGGSQGPSPTKRHPVFLALGASIRKFGLSREHFENLLCAFESDCRVNRHRDFASLLAYCRCSANPVGRLMLELFGHRDPGLFELSDHICTALQLTNFWQDVAVDLERDRVYLPLEDFERFGYSLEDLRAGRFDDCWIRLMAFEVERTRELFERGKALPEKVVPELRRQLRLTWLGGMTILARIEANDYDVFHRRPSLGRLDFLRLYWQARKPLPGALSESSPVVASRS